MRSFSILIGEPCFYFSLGIKLRQKLILPRTMFLQKILFDFFCSFTENFLQHLVSNIRLTKSFIIEPYTSLGKLIYMHRNTRVKVAHDPLHSIDRNTPYPEKTQNMINAKSIEIQAHLPKTLPPPCKIILLHTGPVISREPPVLACGGKIVRWCPSL